MSDMMQCIEIREYGAPEVLILGTRPRPTAGPADVVIEVKAAGVNRPDIVQRQGNYPPPPGDSDLLGLEVAGRIVAVGSEVTTWQVGDAVCALVPGGGYAAYVKAPAVCCLPIPAGLSWVEAAALPETFFTVWHNLFQRGRLLPGETLLVHGGAGGIGSVAIQIGKAFGATVITTAGSAEKCDFCRQCGADLAINYRQQDFVSEVRTFTNKRGADVILDMLGAGYFERNINSLAKDGRLVLVATMQGAVSSINLLMLMIRRQTVTGSTLRAQSVAVKAAIASELQEKVWPLLEAKTLAPQIYRTFPLAEAAAAHQLMERSEHAGKIVLTLE